MAIISGILKDPAGRPIPNCTIELKALKHSLNVIQSTTAGIDVENSGYYSINVEPNDYQVKLYVDGLPSISAGKISVQTDSSDGTLNSFLSAPGEEDLTPEVMKIFQTLADRVTQDAETASKHAEQITNDKNSVELLKQQVQTDYSNVQRLNSNVEQIGSNIELTKQEILAAQDSVQKDKILTKQYADQVLIDKNSVESLKNDAVNVSKVIDGLTEQSKHYANQAEVAAENSKINAERSKAEADRARDIVDNTIKDAGTAEKLRTEITGASGAYLVGHHASNVGTGLDALFQRGIDYWQADRQYYQHNLVNVNGTIYKALTDNQGKWPLDSASEWLIAGVETVNGKSGQVNLNAGDIGAYTKQESNQKCADMASQVKAELSGPSGSYGIGHYNTSVGGCLDGLSQRGIDFWQAERPYYQHNLVNVNGTIYKALTDNQGKRPPDSASDWSIAGVEMVNGRSGYVNLTADDVGAYSKQESDRKLADYAYTIEQQLVTKKAIVNGKNAVLSINGVNADANGNVELNILPPLEYGAVGTDVMATNMSTTQSCMPGSLIAGSALRAGGVNQQRNSTREISILSTGEGLLTGTWRSMGVGYGYGSYVSILLFRRVL